MTFKKHFFAFIFLIMTAGTLTSCATTANYDAQLDYWIGKSERQLVMRWGIPDKQFRLDADTVMISYVKSDIVSYPGTFSGCVGRYAGPAGFAGCSGIPPSIASYYCETTFIIVKRRVARWGHKGNDCRA